jgi:hypothetical protein
VALKRETAVIEPAVEVPAWMRLLLFGAAGLFVSTLLMTYGIDLSPGFF